MSGSDIELSFEFFPHRTPKGRVNLVRTAHRLNEVGPKYFSVTYGAGGSTRTSTYECVRDLLAAGIPTAPHLSWGENSEADVTALMESYLELGASRFVILRGDAPSGTLGRVQHFAAELVALIRKRFSQPICIHVAGYPEVHPDAPSPDADIEFLKEKFDAGADECITQYFYSFEAYLHFEEACRKEGINSPIVPGIMPITNYDNLVRFSKNCGAEIPRWIELRLEAYKDDVDSLLAFGRDVVVNLCQKLIDAEVPGLHFYTLNKAGPTLNVVSDLDFSRELTKGLTRSSIEEPSTRS